MLTLTCDQVRAIDRLAVERYAMPSILLMENAARNAAEIVGREYGRLPDPSAAIFCGPGNNGGDGFAIARHLHNAGWSVTVILAVPAEKLKGDALTNYTIVSRMALPIQPPDAADSAIANAGILIDALLGTGFTGEPRPPLDELIRKINAAGKPIVAVDVPSGLDCFSGRPAEMTVRADLTITFAAAKTAFQQSAAAPHLGKILIADIGVPKELIRDVQGISASANPKSTT